MKTRQKGVMGRDEASLPDGRKIGEGRKIDDGPLSSKDGMCIVNRIEKKLAELLPKPKVNGIGMYGKVGSNVELNSYESQQ